MICECGHTKERHDVIDFGGSTRGIECQRCGCVVWEPVWMPSSAREVERTLTAWSTPQARYFLAVLEAEANRWCNRPLPEVPCA